MARHEEIRREGMAQVVAEFFGGLGPRVDVGRRVEGNVCARGACPMPGRSPFRVWTAAVSLVLGPLLMSVGDAIHPEEDLEAAEQVAILLDDASRWYTAHLLLFIGMFLTVPGILAISGIASARARLWGYVARLLVLMSMVGLGAIFAFEMVLGRFVEESGDAETSTLLLDTFQSGHVFGAVGPAALAFFIGVAIFVGVLARAENALRWPAAVLGVGAAFVLAEIISGEVLLSQIGNVLILVAGSGFAWHIARKDLAVD